MKKVENRYRRAEQSAKKKKRKPTPVVIKKKKETLKTTRICERYIENEKKKVDVHI